MNSRTAQGYTEKPCLEKNKQNKKQTQNKTKKGVSGAWHSVPDKKVLKTFLWFHDRVNNPGSQSLEPRPGEIDDSLFCPLVTAQDPVPLCYLLYSIYSITSQGWKLFARGNSSRMGEDQKDRQSPMPVFATQSYKTGLIPRDCFSTPFQCGFFHVFLSPLPYNQVSSSKVYSQCKPLSNI
jgi:hypothetical protein